MAHNEKISIILPTRGRVGSVKRLFESIIETTDCCEGIEIILYIDEDDPASHNISSSKLSVTKLIRPRENMGKITNICYKASTGDYIILMNDDVLFRTPHWDTIILEKIHFIPDKIFLMYGNDLHKGKKMPTFPIISRKLCEIMDGVCPDSYVRFHIEYHLLDIFVQLKRFKENRIFYIPEVVFEHLHYTIGKSSSDETYLSRNNQVDIYTFVSLARERYYQALKLAQYIKNCRKQHSL